jgi:hypothetical protein
VPVESPNPDRQEQLWRDNLAVTSALPPDSLRTGPAITATFGRVRPGRIPRSQITSEATLGAELAVTVMGET